MKLSWTDKLLLFKNANNSFRDIFMEQFLLVKFLYFCYLLFNIYADLWIFTEYDFLFNIFRNIEIAFRFMELIFFHIDRFMILFELEFSVVWRMHAFFIQNIILSITNNKSKENGISYHYINKSYLNKQISIYKLNCFITFYSINIP